MYFISAFLYLLLALIILRMVWVIISIMEFRTTKTMSNKIKGIKNAYIKNAKTGKTIKKN